MAAVAPNSVGWYILEGYPWWPVFVCDQTKLRPNMHNLGNGHRSILKKARDFPKAFALVYYFGSHEFSLVPLNKGVVLRPWDCEDKELFLKGHPKHLAKRKTTMDELLYSIQEAEDFLAQPEDIRLPPHFVPSDVDPTLEPPPRVTPEEEEADDGEEGEPEDDAGADEAEEDRAEDGDASDGEGGEKKKPKQKKDKKDKPVKKKKERKSKDKKAEPKESRKRKKEPKSKDKEEKPAKAAKAAKVSPQSDVKGDVKTEKKEVPEVPEAPVETVKKTDEPKQEPLEGDELTAKLEKEIRWILLNCQFEEMTTKTVRKLLERRLGMDLRHHKAQIKEGVARVIESMEDGADGPVAAGGEAEEVAAKAEEAGDKAETVKAEVAKEEVAKEEVAKEEGAKEEGAKDEDVAMEDVREEVKQDDAKEVKQDDAKEEKKDVKVEKAVAEEDTVTEEKKTEKSTEEDGVKPEKEEASPSTSERLAEAAGRLEAASVTDEQVLEALASLEAISSVDREALVQSKLQARLVALRAHTSEAVKDKVAALAKQWGVEAALVPKKAVDEKRLLELKAKLESDKTSHDDVFACLEELAEMPVKIAHLKKTKIARTVAKLRQHANDRVSSKANSLRDAWMKLATRDKTEALKSLEKMNHVLEQREEGDKADSAKLEVLDKLLGMSLRTQDIIESKIGVVVSKLRKSSNPKVAKAAAALRKKWKSEAGAA